MITPIATRALHARYMPVTCQACLDHTFMLKRASCLVNPRAGYESELNFEPTATPQKLAVVGAGPAGLAFATVAARRGHEVTLFDGSHRIGGQFNLAKQVSGTVV